MTERRIPPGRGRSPSYPRLDDWIRREAIPFSLGPDGGLDAAVDRLMASLGDRVSLLGFGEALHGAEEILVLRNRLFQRLVTAHGFSAIAIESSLTRGLTVDAYVAGRGPATFEAVRDSGFSHGFGVLEANRELVEWMREYNADPAHAVRLSFYGFDSPTEMMYSDSPRRLLEVPLDYLASADPVAGTAWRERIEALLGRDADWENPAAMMDPAQSVGRTPAADSLRLATEDLITDLRVRGPGLVAANGEDRHREAVHFASAARQLLTYHAAVATPGGGDRVARLLGMRDAMMADHLAYIVARERGQVLAFAHNSHLRRGEARWRLGAMDLRWSPAGAHLDRMLGPRYAAIGSTVGVSEDNGIARPEPGTLEARLAAVPGPALFIPTRRGAGLPAPEIAALPVRSGSGRNSTYFPLTHESLADFDGLAVMDAATYSRGGPSLP